MHSYYMSNRPNASAELMRDLVELDLVKTFNWLPQDIAEIPYKWIQKYYLIEKVKKEAMYTKTEVAKYNSESSSGAGRKGQTRKSVITGQNVVASNSLSKPKTTPTTPKTGKK